MKNVIKADNISYSKNGKLIIDSLSLEFTKGEFVSILGPAGSGKTSLLNILTGGEVDYEGSVYIFGKKINGNKKSSDLHIGVVNEDSDTFETNKVSDELLFSVRNMNLTDEEIGTRIKRVSSSLDIKYLLDYIPNSLSSGEKKLVSLAKVLIKYPDILFVDESFDLIDGVAKDKIFSFLKKLCKEKNMTLIYTTQNIEDALFADRILILSFRKICLDSPLKDAFIDEKIYREAGLGLPFMVELSKKLQYYDLVNKIEFNMDKLVNKLWK